MSIGTWVIDTIDTLLLPLRRAYMSDTIRPLVNASAIRHYTTNPLTLTPVQERIVSDLERDGVATASFDELFPPEQLQELLTYADAHGPSAESRAKKPFILEYWSPFPTLSVSQPFVRLSLDPVVFGIVNRYLGQWAKFYYYMLGLTLPVSPDAAPSTSQRWHRDPEDRRMCKMFIYLRDVDADTGPLTYVRGSHAVGKYGTLFPQRPPKGYYPPPGAVEKTVLPEDIQVVTGRAGTVIFADTSGLHKGGFAKKHERLMFTAGYTSSAAFGKPRYALPADPNELATLSPQQRFALRGVPLKS